MFQQNLLIIFIFPLSSIYVVVVTQFYFLSLTTVTFHSQISNFITGVNTLCQLCLTQAG